MLLERFGLLLLALPPLIGGYVGMFHADAHCRNVRSLLRNLKLKDDYLEPDTVRFSGRVGFALGMAILLVGIINKFT